MQKIFRRMALGFIVMHSSACSLPYEGKDENAPSDNRHVLPENLESRLSTGDGRSLVKDPRLPQIQADRARVTQKRDPTADCTSRGDALTAALEAEYNAAPDQVFGISVALITSDCGEWSAGVGLAGPEEPLTPDHLMRVGSTTKTFVAAAILQLVSTGRLHLEAPLERYVPGIPNGERITIRQLLNQRSGVFDYLSDLTLMTDVYQEILGGESRTYSRADLLKIIRRHVPLFEPDSNWEYSNSNYILLGLVLESVTGKKAPVALRDLAYGPAALRGLFLDGSEPVQGPVARGWLQTKKGSVEGTLPPTVAWTAGALVTTPLNLARWAKQLYGGNILAPAEFEDMLEMQPTYMAEGLITYGLGVLAYPSGFYGSENFGHSGGVMTTNTEMIFFPRHDLALVVVVNSSDTSGLRAVRDAVLSLELPGYSSRRYREAVESSAKVTDSLPRILHGLPGADQVRWILGQLTGGYRGIPGPARR